MTATEAEDNLTMLQSLDLIQYRKGRHVIICTQTKLTKLLDRHLKASGRVEN